ncbi:MAG: hypothetical protein GY856_34740 [bacterium]|nr:hypothetical protein [bacterium]
MQRIPWTGVLDEAEGLVAAVAAPWVGVLWLSLLPLRLLQVHFVDRVIELGTASASHGLYFSGLSLALGAAAPAATYGRAVFVRACGAELGGGAAGGSAWRVPAAAGWSFLYVSLALETLLLGFAVLVIAWPLIVFVVLFSGLAAAACPFVERPSILAPWRQLLRYSRRPWVPIMVLAVMGLAFLLAALNLGLGLHALLWLGTAAGIDPAGWSARLGLSNELFVLLVTAGAALLVEPFWLAANVSFVARLRARTSGEDLRLAFAELAGKEHGR